ncbi:MAG: hypothetical protein KatS3mg018_1081 [Fimbriimonadales bacterium]|nr:MAG: hypothetical protein KatS3mg018_1081 [Fimbriimonadales bacterium]
MIRPTTKHPADVCREALMSRSGSSRLWSSHLLGLVMAVALCFTLSTSVLRAQDPCVFADVNGDGIVDDADLLRVLFCFGTETEQTIPQLNRMVASRLPSAFPRSFPAAPGVNFDPENAAFARTRITRTPDSFFDVFVAWDTRADFEQFSPPRIAEGLIVGATYLPRGESPTGQPIPEGWYLVQMQGTPDLETWRINLLDARTGAPVAVGISASANLTPPFVAPRAWNDIEIRIVRLTNGAFCVQIYLTYMCPNGVILDRTLVWQRCFP